MESSLRQYTFYADTCRGSLERARQTIVGAIPVDLHPFVANFDLSHCYTITWDRLFWEVE